MSKAKLRREISPAGLTLWHLPDSQLQIMWPGPGSRLLIGNLITPGGAHTHIDHPTARNAYQTRSEAQAAVTAFVAAAQPDD